MGNNRDEEGEEGRKADGGVTKQHDAFAPRPCNVIAKDNAQNADCVEGGEAPFYDCHTLDVGLFLNKKSRPILRGCIKRLYVNYEKKIYT
jgi:hypothetical protein